MTDTRSCILCACDLEPVELLTCRQCVSDVRRDLTSIQELFAVLPSLLGKPDGASLGAVMGGRSDEAALPGGDVLAMLGPGGDGGEGHPSDPPAVAFELWQWQQDWAEIRGEAQDHQEYAQPAIQVLTERVDLLEVPLLASPGRSVPALVAWLGIRLEWAGSHHMAFDDFAADVCRIRACLAAVTGTLDSPETGAPCIYCQAVNLERRFGDDGRADDWTCPRCRRVFDEVHYRLAVGQMLMTARLGA